MNAREITERLRTALEQHNCRMSLISAEHLPELRGTIQNDRQEGLIDTGVYRQNSRFFDRLRIRDGSWAQSVLVVAVPSPILEVVFSVNGRTCSTIIPPNYEESLDQAPISVTEHELTSRGYRVERAVLPLKLLAARSDLARYGKNNIAYVEGMGSYIRLLAFYTDLPAVQDAWQEPRELDECVRCTACIKKCPTGAIEPDRFRVRAERCLTYHNESTDDFPSWIDDSWHHCLIGCMRCQQYCPGNKDVLSWKRRYAEFTEEETALLMDGMNEDELPEELAAKINISDLLENRRGTARNLRSLLANDG